MNSRLLVSIAVPAAAFALTIAVWRWQQRGAEPTPAVAQPEHAAAPRAPLALSSLRTEDPRPQEIPAVRPAPAPAPTNTVDQDTGRIKVPVGFVARARPDASGLTASLVNMTTDELAVTVTAVSAKTHLRSAVDVTLRAHERRNLAADGLELGSGDQVTIQSPPFRDVVVKAQ
ncbi:MAG: hypothetical protein WBF89_14550 [Steroidobacteraceae bacterium]